MSEAVYKYIVPLADSSVVVMPAGAVILHAVAGPHRQSQESLTVWARVSTDAPVVERSFAVRGTGHALGAVGPYIATVLDGPFVWHLFEGVPS